MIANRWEKERAAWLLAHSNPATSRRRQAELLKSRHSRAERQSAGVADTTLHEDLTPRLYKRMLATDEGAGERLARKLWVPVLFAGVGIAIGPAIALAQATYYVMWRKSPKIGRLWVWPWLTASVLVAALGAGAIHFWNIEPGAWLVPWPLALHVYLPTFIPTWVWAQVTLALLLTGLKIRGNGWAAVKHLAGLGKTGSRKNADGSFKKVAEEDLITLVPYKGSGPKKSASTAAPSYTQRPQRPPLGVLTPTGGLDSDPEFDGEIPAEFEDLEDLYDDDLDDLDNVQNAHNASSAATSQGD